MRVLHVITGLDTGGAEWMLWKLLSATRDRMQHEVVSLQPAGKVGPAIAALGVPVQSLGIRRRMPNPLRAALVARVTRTFRPNVVQGWMYHGNLVATLATVCARERPRLAWNIRQTLYDVAKERPLTAAAIRAGALTSHMPDTILYNSQVSREQHEGFGYRRRSGAIIRNGVDCQVFRPDGEARQRVRDELGIAKDAVLVGLVARYHPMKDHANFLRAAAELARESPGVRFVLMGEGVTWQQPSLARLISELQLRDRVSLLGERLDVPRLTAALDLACSSSAWGEGFSNAVAEAMACGIPVVVTDIGASSFIAGAGGAVVPARDPVALAAAITQLLRDEGMRQRMGLAARCRIETEFSLPVIARQYEDIYRRMVTP
jgi:glycosyltransferase involved in cell wall biosynthesis